MLREPLYLVAGVRTPFSKMGTLLAGMAADELGRMARMLGFLEVASAPFVRSSYHADEMAVRSIEG